MNSRSFEWHYLQASGEALDVQWIAIDQNIDLYANHEWIIEKVRAQKNIGTEIIEHCF